MNKPEAFLWYLRARRAGYMNNYDEVEMKELEESLCNPGKRFIVRGHPLR